MKVSYSAILLLAFNTASAAYLETLAGGGVAIAPGGGHYLPDSPSPDATPTPTSTPTSTPTPTSTTTTGGVKANFSLDDYDQADTETVTSATGEPTTTIYSSYTNTQTTGRGAVTTITFSGSTTTYTQTSTSSFYGIVTRLAVKKIILK